MLFCLSLFRAGKSFCCTASFHLRSEQRDGGACARPGEVAEPLSTRRARPPCPLHQCHPSCASPLSAPSAQPRLSFRQASVREPCICYKRNDTQAQSKPRQRYMLKTKRKSVQECRIKRGCKTGSHKPSPSTGLGDQAASPCSRGIQVADAPACARPASSGLRAQATVANPTAAGAEPFL